MRKGALVLILLAWITLVAGVALAGGGGANCDPTRPPSFPKDPPPACGAPSGHVPAPPRKASEGEPFTRTYQLVKGWNIVSFPFSRVLELKGFKRMLLSYGGGSYYLLDGQNNPSEVNPRLGYLVYADAPGVATARGIPNNANIRAVSFECGWNLCGCPKEKNIPWNMLGAVIGTSMHLAGDVAALPGDEGNYWLSARVYRFNKGLLSEDIRTAGTALIPGQGTWVFVWHPLNLTVMPGKQSGARLDRVTPSSVSPGQTVTLEGSGLGSDVAGLFLAGVPIKGDYILSWSPTRIMFRVPSYAMSGSLLVCMNRTPSNKLSLTVSEDQGPGAGGTLSGKIQDGNKRPLKGALVMLSNGLSAYSKDDGTFLIGHIPAGEWTLDASLTGHRAAHGKVSLGENASKAFLITLTAYGEVVPQASESSGAAAGRTSSEEKIVSEKANLDVVVSAYYYGNTRWWVYRVYVKEWGNGNYYWHNTWYNDAGDTYYELKCPGARMGKTYTVYAEWRSKENSKILTNSWQRKIYKQYQKENFDSPM
ncbi:MAG: IPT/TIG domain-containing protein [Candidatus Eremiobacteraeota bacterium]|nr:IPT/TIG domain-containing protein [Candidatus Eremiobacteraeota bacterium]